MVQQLQDAFDAGVHDPGRVQKSRLGPPDIVQKDVALSLIHIFEAPRGQRKICVTTINKLAVYLKHPEGKREVFDPVSYTHLDVYKRQGEPAPANTSQDVAQPDAASAEQAQVADAFDDAEAQVEFMPGVSLSLIHI